ncbi:MAG TPA: RNA 3'-terminal phosphate cyclase [Candidatus Nanoarchaeia archaeon]|nr:RNA 3'-terminal phosphate cyclase [Candidatus Nanoarchaeia archaeon]
MIQIDGSKEEGGGAIVRQALGLSVLTGKPFEVTNIRKNRPVPGLKAQHLHSINALQRLCNAKVSGNFAGSESLEFTPGSYTGGDVFIDIGTAGSITLLLQSIVLPAAFTPVKTKLKIRGGTDVAWSPSIDYFQHVFLPVLRRFAKVEFKILRRGYFPVGGGEVEIEIEGRPEKQPLILEKRGTLQLIKGIAHASIDLEEQRVTERIAKTAEVICSSLKVPAQVRQEYLKTACPGCGITLWGIAGDTDEWGPKSQCILGADGLGEKTKKSEDLGKEVAERLVSELSSEAPVDHFLADQLIPFVAWCGGKLVTSEISKHVHANIYVAQQFLEGKWEVQGNQVGYQS